MESLVRPANVWKRRGKITFTVKVLIFYNDTKRWKCGHFSLHTSCFTKFSLLQNVQNMIIHKFQRIWKLKKLKNWFCPTFKERKWLSWKILVSTIVKTIIFVVFVLLHFKSGDPLANRFPPILAAPPSQVPNKSLDAVLIATVWIQGIAY